MKIPKAVLSAYDLGEIQSIRPVKTGLVHETFEIRAGRDQYIIQKLHPVLSSKAVAEDFLAVTRFLEEKKFPTPKCVLSKRGSVLVKQGKNAWRMQTKLPGKTIDVIDNNSMAREAGEIYAGFHKVLDQIDYKFKAKKFLHETEKIYTKFLHLAPPPSSRRGGLGGGSKEVELIKTNLPKFFLPSNLPLRVIHGDPKISNILFDRNGKAKAIIDLDTCNRHPLLVELGDAFRSWCGNEEDDPKNKFCLRKFKSAWAGYKKGAEGFITAQEIRYVPKCIGTITLELACRFLTDYFEDSYFGWDSNRYESRKAHNLARTRGQIAEFLDYKKKLPKIRKIVSGN